MFSTAIEVLNRVVDVIMDGYERKVSETGVEDPEWPVNQFVKHLRVVSEASCVHPKVLLYEWIKARATP